MIRKVLNKKLMKLTLLHDENNRIFKSIVWFKKIRKSHIDMTCKKNANEVRPDGPERQNKNNVTNYVM